MADIKYLDYGGLQKFGALINKKFAAGISGTLSSSTATIYLNNNTPSTTASGAESPDMFEAIDSVVIPSASQSLAGLMSSDDKKKLDGIASGAQPGTVTSVAIKAGDGISISSESAITTSGTRTISLDVAATNVIGGIKVGKVAATAPQYTSDGSGAYYKVNATSDGTAYVALPSFKTTQTAVNDPTASGTAFSFIDTLSQAASGKITATKKTVPTATNTTLGLVKGGTTSNKTYGVNIDSNGSMTVAVPWTDTLFKTASISAATSATTPDTDTVNVVSNTTVSITGTDGKSASGSFTAVKVPTQKYVDNLIDGLSTEIENLSLSALEYKGTLVGKTDTAYGGLTVKAAKGDVYIVTTAGKVNGVTVEVGDAFLCTADVNAATSTTYADAQKSWTVLNTNWSASNTGNQLKWNEAVTIATVGGVNITAKLPANPDTNTSHDHGVGSGLSKSGSAGTSGGTVTYSLKTAAYNEIGGVKPAYVNSKAATLGTAAGAVSNAISVQARSTNTDRYYAVESDKNGVPYVNVPWTDNNTTSFTIGANANDDDVIVLSGTAGTNSVTYTASHAKQGPTNGATSTATSAQSPGHGGTATLNIPSIAVNEYGHVTSLTNQAVTLTLPGHTNHSISKGTCTNADLSITNNGATSTIGVTVPIGGTNLGVVKAGKTNGKTYGVAIDANGAMTVSVPWTDKNTHYTTHLYAGSSNTTAHSTSDVSDPYLRLFDDSTARESVQFKAGNLTSVKAKSGVITIAHNNTYTAITEAEIKEIFGVS